MARTRRRRRAQRELIQRAITLSESRSTSDNTISWSVSRRKWAGVGLCWRGSDADPVAGHPGARSLAAARASRRGASIRREVAPAAGERLSIVGRLCMGIISVLRQGRHAHRRGPRRSRG